MGGGYAFRATVKNPKVKACVSLFPLLMNFADQGSIPVWMKRGKWSSYQYCEDYLDSMKFSRRALIPLTSLWLTAMTTTG